MKNTYLFILLIFCFTLAIPYSIQAQYGAIDNNGKIVIPFEYDRYWLYDNGYVTVKKDGKVGMIDMEGKEIIPFEYEAMAPFAEGLAMVKQNGKCGYIDTSGKVVLPLQFDNAHPFKNGLAMVMNRDGRKINKGLINKKGEVVLPIEYEMVTPQDNGNYYVYKNYKYGVFDKDGNEVIPVIYSNLLGPVCDRYMGVLKGKTGYLDEHGKELIPFIYDRGRKFQDDFAIVTKDGKNILIDKKGNVIPTPDCDNLDGPYDGMIKFVKDKKSGFLALDGKEVIPAIYTNAGVFFDGLAVVSKEKDKRGMINKKGKTIIPFIYKYIGYFKHGYASVQKGEKVGLIDKSGKVVVPLIYDEIRSFENGFAIIRKGSGYGLMDSTLNVIAPAIYDTYAYVQKDTDRIWLKKDGKMGAIDHKGNVIIPFVFDKARIFKDGLSICKTDNPETIASLLNMGDKQTPVATPPAKLKLQFVSQKTEGSTLSLSYRFINEGKSDVLILKPQTDIPEFGVNPELTMTHPEFFNAGISEAVVCMYAPMFSDMGIGSSSNDPAIPFKQVSDFVTIAAGSEVEITINFPNYKSGICKENISEFKFKLIYQFDKMFLDRSYFGHRAKESQLSETERMALYKLLEKCYKGKVVSDEITILMQ